MPLSDQIFQVMQSLEHVKIDATYDNMNYMLGSLMKLRLIWDCLKEAESKEANIKEQNQNGRGNEQ